MLSMPLLPMRDTVVFPGVSYSFIVGRKRSLSAFKAASKMGTYLFLTMQKIPCDNPNQEQLHEIGSVVQILSYHEVEEGRLLVNVVGKWIALLNNIDETGDYPKAEVTFRTERGEETLLEFDKLNAVERTKERIQELKQANKILVTTELQDTLEMEADIDLFTHRLCAYYPSLDPKLRQTLLETPTLAARFGGIFEIILNAHLRWKAENEENKAGRQQATPGRVVFRNPNVHEVQRSEDEFKAELLELSLRIEHAQLNEDVREKLRKELRKLRMMQPMSSDAALVRNYIDVVLSLPWNKYTTHDHDIFEAQTILDKDHYGLQKPKERMLEFLAVQTLVTQMRGPILCLVGPPGVGKTSLAKSLAHAMGRNFVRASLGGVKDEAEIRGHRRTYVGAMPGKIIQSIIKAECLNPVFLLDEVDKLSSDYHGDPASALLEVLDPEQNSTFNDHYIDIDFNLSEVIFIATANNKQSIPPPLLDRMEIIDIEGYTEDEKLNIAQNFLLPKQMQQNGIDCFEIQFAPEALTTIIHEYTMEAGVRALEREISTICRKLACEIVKNSSITPRKLLKPKDIKTYLGTAHIRQRDIELTDEIGVTNALAVTPAGGSTLKSEVTIMPGKGKLIITGQLRDVMQESAQAAMSYVRSRAANFGLIPNFISQIDIHVHFPGDHIPKDGPSAGITMATSIISALTRIPVKRDVAMTGEITLRGRVLAIGGLKEKLLAAKRLGVKTVIIPKENAQDLAEIPKKLLSGLKVIQAFSMEDVLMHALCLDDPEKFEAAIRAPQQLYIAITPDSSQNASPEKE